MYRRISILTPLLMALLCSVPVFASDTEQMLKKDAVNKINISGRQRMLTQRMAKSACFAHLDVARDAHLTALGAARELFEYSLVALSKGNPDLGVLPEDDAGILEELQEVFEIWTPYQEIILEVEAEGARNIEPLYDISRQNLPVLKQANSAVAAFEARYGAGAIDELLASTVNTAGRQRMLIQRAAKEYCFALAGIERSANEKALMETISLFANSQVALQFGDVEYAVIAPLNSELDWQYRRIETLWSELEPMFYQVADGGQPTPAQIERVAELNNVLLVEMNKAVEMY